MPPPQPPACRTANYVTLLTGPRYAAAAACLPHQLRRVGALICPILLVYNDADTLLPLDMLTSAYGSEHMVPLSRLQERFNQFRATQSKVTPIRGRRLFDGSEVQNTHLKLWLWAMPERQRLVFLDIDTLILRNISELLTVEPAQHAESQEGIASITCKSKYGSRFFNSGLLVFSPSLKSLNNILEVERFSKYPWNGYIPHMGKGSEWVDICSPRDDPLKAERMPEFARRPNSSSSALGKCRSKYGGRTPVRMSKACESKFTDQSILNHVYQKHTLLSHTFNDNSHFSLRDSHIIHFVGEKKPWDPTRDRYASEARRNATRMWQHRCARFMHAFSTEKNYSRGSLLTGGDAHASKLASAFALEG